MNTVCLPFFIRDFLLDHYMSATLNVDLNANEDLRVKLVYSLHVCQLKSQVFLGGEKEAHRPYGRQYAS
jgi:hypothetical protein